METDISNRLQDVVADIHATFDEINEDIINATRKIRATTKKLKIERLKREAIRGWSISCLKSE